MSGPHPSHVTRCSDASTFDEICVNCGAHDVLGGGWGALARPCPHPPPSHVADVSEPHVVALDAPTTENDPIGRFRKLS